MKKVLSTTFAIAMYTMSCLAQSENDKKAIEKIVATMEEGWVQKDGKKFASSFADVHDFVVWNGYYFPNNTRNTNAMVHQGLFNGPFKTMDIRLKVDKIKFIRPDIALTHLIGVGYEKGTELPKDPGVLMTILLEKKGENWEIISFHNLDLEAFENEQIKKQMPFPAEVMYANWYKK